MGADDHGAAPAGEAADDAQHGLHLHVVEVGRRLIGHHQRWVERQGTGDRNALHLPSRQHARTVRHPFGKADVAQQFAGALASSAPAHPRREHRHHHVLGGGEAGHQVERLEHDTDHRSPVRRELLGGERGDLVVAHPDGARGGTLQPGEARQQGGLAAPRWAQQDGQSTCRHRGAEPVERPHRCVAGAVLDGHPVEGDHRATVVAVTVVGATVVGATVVGVIGGGHVRAPRRR